MARRFSAAATVCGIIFVVGGFSGLGFLSEAVIEPTCEVFDPCQYQWNLVCSPKVPRAACGIASVDETVYVFGGQGAEGLLGSVECFDAKCNEWYEIDSPMPVPLAFVEASLLKVPKRFIHK